MNTSENNVLDPNKQSNPAKPVSKHHMVFPQTHPACLKPLPILLVESMHWGLAPSVEDLLSQPHRKVAQRSGCVVDASGQVYEESNGILKPCEKVQHPSSGRMYYEFGTFKLWALRTVYVAFIEEDVPELFRVEPRDGNHANCRLDNLVLKGNPDKIEEFLAAKKAASTTATAPIPSTTPIPAIPSVAQQPPTQTPGTAHLN